MFPLSHLQINCSPGELHEAVDFEVLKTGNSQQIMRWQALVSTGPDGRLPPIMNALSVQRLDRCKGLLDLPQNFNQSKRMRWVEELVQRDLSLLHYRESNDTSWYLEEGVKLHDGELIIHA